MCRAPAPSGNAAPSRGAGTTGHRRLHDLL